MREIVLGNKIIGLGHPCFLVAEVGINHNGDLGLALEMIDAAAAAGADAVKFQNYATEDFIQDRALTYSYTSQGQTVTESQYDLFKRCELSADQLADLKTRCDERGVVFLSTPTSAQGVRLLKELGAPLLKNGSDFLTHLELVAAMGASGVPTVLSTGMATCAEIEDAVRAFRDAGGRDCLLLRCTSAYPAPLHDVNLRAIPALAQTFGCLAGFSDHTQGTIAAVGAVALGACMVEKHFTLSRDLPGPDQWFSSDSEGFRRLVEEVRALELCLGRDEIGPAQSDVCNRASFRLSCCAAQNFPAGYVLRPGDVVFRRPGIGFPPKEVRQLLGRALACAVKAGATITSKDVL